MSMSPSFDFPSSFAKTLMEYEHISEAAQADFERAQEWRKIRYGYSHIDESPMLDQSI